MKKIRKNSKYWLKKLRALLSPEMKNQIEIITKGLVCLRRRLKPLWLVDQKEARALIKELDGLIESLAEMRISLVAGLPSEKWAGVGSKTPHEEAIGC